MASPKQVVFVVFLVVVITAFIGAAYVTALSDVQIYAVLFLVLIMLSFAAVVVFKQTKLTESSLDDELKVFALIQSWWKKKANEELTYTNSKFMERYVGEIFHVARVSRRGAQLPLGVIIGTKPSRVVWWDYVSSFVSLNDIWKEYSPMYPGAPSQHAKPEESVYSMKDKPSKVIEREKETKTESKWEKDSDEKK